MLDTPEKDASAAPCARAGKRGPCSARTGLMPHRTPRMGSKIMIPATMQVKPALRPEMRLPLQSKPPQSLRSELHPFRSLGGRLPNAMGALEQFVDAGAFAAPLLEIRRSTEPAKRKTGRSQSGEQLAKTAQDDLCAGEMRSREVCSLPTTSGFIATIAKSARLACSKHFDIPLQSFVASPVNKEHHHCLDSAAISVPARETAHGWRS